MAQASAIEWTETTWNPVTGCSKVSPGCKNCYAERMALRLQAMGTPKYRDGFETRTHVATLTEPHRWKKPRLVFVNSMSDLFHDQVSDFFIEQVFQTMVETPRHTYQILTKRPERLVKICKTLPWPENVWMGVSVESPDYYERIRLLKKVPAAVRFLSLEPLLAPLPRLPLKSIHWVIVGGESGPGARPIQEQWVRDIQSQCAKTGIAFFFKQWGGFNKKASGRLLDDRLYDELPVKTMG